MSVSKKMLKKGASLLLKKFFSAYSVYIVPAILIIIALFFVVVTVVGFMATQSSNEEGIEIGGGKKELSPSVLKWKSQVEKEAKEQDVLDLVPYVLAIIQVETNGNSKDLMQSSESAGLPVNSLDEIGSIHQGIKYLKSGFDKLNSSVGGKDILGVIQSYNFGTAYVDKLLFANKKHTLDFAENYSKTVVAPSLGNSSGQTYSYINDVSTLHGKPYLYLNGGNFFYAELVLEYVGTGSGNGGTSINPQDYYKDLIAEAEKYEGNPYVWGGSNPSEGFDCSGLTQWVYGKSGFQIGRVTTDQYASTQKVSLSDAKSGDLVFFKGTYGSPDYISHVGIYVNENTMYDANDSGIGYHNLKASYWQEHFDSIRRVQK